MDGCVNAAQPLLIGEPGPDAYREGSRPARRFETVDTRPSAECKPYGDGANLISLTGHVVFGLLTGLVYRTLSR